MRQGVINQIIGPVIDIKFEEGNLPELLNAIKIPHGEQDVMAEVAQHIGDDVVRCVALSSTDGLTRGMEALDTGAPITVPVGDEVLGRLFNVMGQTIDDKGPVHTTKTSPIHKPAPSFEDQNTKSEIYETGIKVIDLIAPVYPRRQGRSVRRRGCRQDSSDPGADQQHCQRAWRHLCLCGCRRADP